MSKRRVAYYYDPDVGAYSYGVTHAMKPQRMRITHELVSAYDMLPKMHVLRAKRASAEKMTRFHTDEYVDFLSKVTPENARRLTYQGTRFLVGDDNPPFEGVFEFCSISAGGSIAAANRLMDGHADIAINWAGGLHHAKKREASGFCYINDIVLGILEMLRYVPRVLYIDIDCHHGDGVEEAFYTTDRVMTCSIHKFGEFFPGTGQLSDRGRGKGRGYAVNIPLKDGITDESYRSVFEPVIDKIVEVFRPSAIVLQCGADSLSGDKLGGLNLTMHGHAHCVQYVRSKNIPFMLVGGGGYTVKNVARAWTYETACALNIENDIDLNLPWNEYFEWFGPRYRLEVLPSNLEDYNLKDGSLDKVREEALRHLSELRPAPSVQMQDVPRESLGDHLGLGGVHAHAPIDDLDERLAQHARFVYDLQKDSDRSDSEAEDAPEDDPESERNAHTRRTSRRVQQQQKRMSIVTSKYFDVPRLPPEFERDVDEDPCGVYANAGAHGRKRRFFQSVAEWDPVKRHVLERERAGVVAGMGMGMGILGANGFDARYMRVPVRDAGSEERESMDVDPDGDEDEE
ncbi:histone deacetylase [Lentinus tigrinus ALCF2SS1-7]|uniref:histone deacetylase n=1 Tax=Lentinus tigrinus ALCF2SS1-6 TaxID=1328759 RepID=A0A5C2SUJ4_9APHY|nr:histone deacetylase [Lentinus tigrinus ALCF2SS1-6]RPD81482.1 histone deacetylase [Lentinus tigrinus ALCF2SS1-7]